MPQSMLASMWMPSAEELSQLAPLFALVATIVALLLAAMFTNRNRNVAASIVTLGAIGTGLLAWKRLQSGAPSWAGFDPNGMGPMLISDTFSQFFIVLACVFMLVVTAMWWLGQKSDLPDSEVHRMDATEFFVLFVGSAFGMSLMVSTTNLLMIILAVEMASLPSYGITAFRKKNRVAAEASMKYVLFGAITSAIMIYGASLLYGYYQTLDLATIGMKIAADMQAGATTGTLFLSVAVFAFMVGIAFKVSAVPFHFWCPDVFQGASIEVTTWLSVASKAAGLGLMLRVLSVIICAPSAFPVEAFKYVSLAIAIMAALTCTVGNLAAYRQMNLKRLLAYSSIAHAGYMLMAVAILWSPTDAGIGAAHPAFSAIVSYIIVYLLMNAGAFFVVAMVYWSTGSESITAMNGLIRRSPMLAVCMAIILFSLVGMPPLGGFMAKFYLLMAVWKGGLYWLVVIAVLNTLISLYYYARIVRAMILTDDGLPEISAPMSGQLIVAMCTIGIILTGVLLGPMKEIANNNASNLYAVVKSDVAPRTASAAGPSAATPNTENADTAPTIP
ncbi:MAG: NADH-quinone oxidoreductase subunit N [Phycisphaerales bacterium]|nr:NADH-quinone oxidoreductase subunit N [Phycisphaerales bacterium]MCB9856165.1 NADH-quinone oxidoreductase subunit N [Phycisphaerales bacterium]